MIRPPIFHKVRNCHRDGDILGNGAYGFFSFARGKRTTNVGETLYRKYIRVGDGMSGRNIVVAFNGDSTRRRAWTADQMRYKTWFF